MNLKLFTLIVLIGNVTGQGMTCFECEHPDIRYSSLKPACNDEQRDFGRIKTCPPVNSFLKTVCKTVRKGDIVQGRDCEVINNESSRSACIRNEEDNTTCSYCDTNLCNSSFGIFTQLPILGICLLTSFSIQFCAT